MFEQLPGYYGVSRTMKMLMDAQGFEADKLWKEAEGTLNQYFVSSATWGLELWESVLGIPVDKAKPVEQRRSVILSKIRGVGTVTAALIKQVAEAYDHGEVAVTEEYADYNVTITFVSTLGIPPNLENMKSAIREILPAHLTVKFVFRFYTYGELAAAGSTYGQLADDGYTYDDIFNGRMR